MALAVRLNSGYYILIPFFYNLFDIDLCQEAPYC